MPGFKIRAHESSQKYGIKADSLNELKVKGKSLSLLEKISDKNKNYFKAT